MSGSWLLIRRRIGNALLQVARDNRGGSYSHRTYLLFHNSRRVGVDHSASLVCPFIPISSGSVILTVLVDCWRRIQSLRLPHDPITVRTVVQIGRVVGWRLISATTSCGRNVDQQRNHHPCHRPDRPLSAEPMLDSGIPEKGRREEDEAEDQPEERVEYSREPLRE